MGSPSGGIQATLATGGGREALLFRWCPRSHFAIAFGDHLAPEASTGWGARGAPQEENLRPPAFNCLQEAQNQLQCDTLSAGAPTWLVKSLVSCNAK